MTEQEMNDICDRIEHMIDRAAALVREDRLDDASEVMALVVKLAETLPKKKDHPET